jgi:hypothetical protein
MRQKILLALFTLFYTLAWISGGMFLHASLFCAPANHHISHK